MKDRRDKPRLGIVVLLIALPVALGVGGWVAGDALNEKDAVVEHYDDTRDDLVDVCKDEDNADKPECASTPPPPEDIVDEATTDDGEPSDAQVRAAVNDRLPVLIGQGIAAYCADDRCKADTPPKPKDGEDGEDAPPLTQAQRAQDVADFCAVNGDCRGADGTNGTDGTDGEDAPTVTSITCTGMTPVTFTYTFSDGSQIVAECEMLPPVDEGP